MIDAQAIVEIYTQKILKASGDKKRRVLFKLGGYMRTTEARSFRVSAKYSTPGQPPKVRSSGSPLRQLVAFEVDLDKERVVTGPMIFAGTKLRSSKPLPQLLDQGGSYVQPRPGGEGVMAQMAARPFRGATYQKGLARFQELVAKEQL